MPSAGWNKLGIAGEDHYVGKVFNSPASIIAQFYKKLEDPYGIRSLYVRGINDSEYRRLTPETDSLDYREYITSPDKPVIYVNVWDTVKYRGEYTGYDWVSLQEIDIRNGNSAIVFDDSNTVVTGSQRRSWISDILGFGTDGSSLVGTVAVEKQTAPCRWSVEYWVSSLNLKNRSIETLSLLKETFI